MAIYNASEEATTPATPTAGRQLLYPKSDGFYSKNSAGVETKLVAAGTIIASEVANTPAGSVVATTVQTAIDELATESAAHLSNIANPHAVTKTQVGLANVDNTSDANKPVSTAQATADATVLSSAAIDATNKANAAQAASTPIAHSTNTANPHAVTKTQVGLGNVDNTTDLAKPVSTATKTALDAKTDLTRAYLVTLGSSINLPNDTNLLAWANTLPASGIYDCYLSVAQGSLSTGWWYLELIKFHGANIGNTYVTVVATSADSGVAIKYVNTCQANAWSGWTLLLTSGDALGTPSSGTLTNCTGLPLTGVSGTLAQLNTAITDADIARTDAGQTFTGNQVVNGAVTVSQANSTSAHQVSIAGSLTFDTPNLSAQLISTAITGGVSTTLLRIQALSSILTPVSDCTIQGVFNQAILNSSTSGTRASVDGLYTAIILGASATGGTIATMAGNTAAFNFNASSTTAITELNSYRAPNAVRGASHTIGAIYSYYSGQLSTNAADRCCYMLGTAPNYFNGAVLIGSNTNNGVDKLQVTGSIFTSSTIQTGGYLVSTLPAIAAGKRAYVTDALAPSYLAALVGGGSVVSPAFCNGTTWVSA